MTSVQSTKFRTAWLSDLDPFQATPSERKTGIICTLGPSTNTPEAITELRLAGMNIGRLNFSHGTHEYHSSIVRAVRTSMEQSPGREIAIALDTKGPEIRIGDFENPEGYDIVAGSTLLFTTDPERRTKGNLSDGIYFDYMAIGTTVSNGKMIYIDDGNLSLCIESMTKKGKKFINRKNRAILANFNKSQELVSSFRKEGSKHPRLSSRSSIHFGKR
jgi:pyruvate kinase